MYLYSVSHLNIILVKAALIDFKRLSYRLDRVIAFLSI
jgi:hypothetical protein